MTTTTPKPRPFRFAAGLPDRVDLAGLTKYARRVEAWGYSTLLLPDHLFERFAPIPALAAVAAGTSRLRIGTFMLNVSFRHPAVLAKELATLDRLSDGRLEIGLGVGWNAGEHHQAGLPFEPHRLRVERLRETVEILEGLFTPGALTFTGRRFEIADLEGRPAPVQRPHPPLLIGGGGRLMLELAARHAQIVGLAARVPAPFRHDPLSCLAEATAEKIAWVREAAGDRFDDIELNTYPVLAPVRVAANAPAAARTLAHQLRERDGIELSEAALLDSPHVFFGTVEQLVDKCEGLRERFGISYIMAGAEAEAFAPVVERLAGR
jgi:probable F420-dependent oxidoreductase